MVKCAKCEARRRERGAIVRNDRKAADWIIVIVLLAMVVGGMYYFSSSSKEHRPEAEAAEVATDYDDSNQLARDHESLDVGRLGPDYGGAYRDENGALIIGTVSMTDELLEFAAHGHPNDKIQYRLVENSMIELMETMDTLNPLMAELNISSLQLDERSNKINVYIKEMTEEKMNAIAEQVNAKTIQFHEQILDVIAP